MPTLEIDTLIATAAKDLGICNACRYCEGYCAVFPAMERRLVFAQSDLNYIANLCHNCGECLHACQYAPPHAFAVNVPQSLARVRAASYRQYAWPGPFASLFHRHGVRGAVGLAAVFVVLLWLAVLQGGAPMWGAIPGGDFYRLMPHGVMAGTFGAVGLFVLVALAVGALRFWRDGGEPVASLAALRPWREAVRDAVTLKYLHGGGTGCAEPDGLGGTARRWAHHLTAGGFLLCFAATGVATVYHYGFGWHAPYALTSLTVVLGTVGGLGLLVGPPLLWWLRRQRDAAARDVAQDGMDDAFIAMLWLTSASGLLLLGVRETALIGTALVVHLGIVMALFVLLPYGKFVHGVYRVGALLRFAVERVRAHAGVGGD